MFLQKCFPLIATLALLAALVLPASSSANSIFIEFKGPSNGALALTGDSLVDGFRNHIILESVSFAVSTSIATTSKGSSLVAPANFSDITITKQIDRSSTQMMQTAAAGGFYTDVVINYVRPRGGSGDPLATFVYFKVELKDVLISSYTSNASSDGIPQESFSLNYRAIRTSFIPQLSTGAPGPAIVGTWNIATNRPDFRDAQTSVNDPVPAGEKPASTGTEVTVE